jgi:hypothetical protein
MTLLTVSLPTTGTARGSEEVDVGNALAAILADYNGSITPENLKNGGVAENWVLPALAAKLGLASRAATQTVVQTMATGWQSPIGVSITQPDPGFTLVFWQAQVRLTSGPNGIVGLSVDGIIDQPRDPVSFTNTGAFLYNGETGEPRFRMVPYNLTGSHSFQVTGAINSGSGIMQNAALRVFTVGF